MRFREDSIDKGSANEGYARELERSQHLFRDLQTEFLIAMEEKRQGNEILLRGAKIKERDIERAVEQGKVISNGSLEILLPKLKKKHEQSNNDISNR